MIHVSRISTLNSICAFTSCEYLCVCDRTSDQHFIVSPPTLGEEEEQPGHQRVVPAGVVPPCGWSGNCAQAPAHHVVEAAHNSSCLQWLCSPCCVSPEEAWSRRNESGPCSLVSSLASSLTRSLGHGQVSRVRPLQLLINGNLRRPSTEEAGRRYGAPPAGNPFLYSRADWLSGLEEDR